MFSVLSLCALATYLAAIVVAFGMPEATFVGENKKFLLDVKVTKPKLSVYFSHAVGIGCRLAPAGFLDIPGTIMWGPSNEEHRRTKKLDEKVFRGESASLLMSVEQQTEVFAVILFAFYVLPVGVFVRVGKLL